MEPKRKTQSTTCDECRDSGIAWTDLTECPTCGMWLCRECMGLGYECCNCENKEDSHA